MSIASRGLLPSLLLGCTAAALAGCGGYGDESPEEAVPPLLQMQAVNDWLKEYQRQHGAVPKTYEELKTLYEERTGRKWPPFPAGGSWVYFPHRARVIEVRESRVRAWLKLLTRKLEKGRFHLYGLDRVADYFRRKEGIDIRMPGYEIVFVKRGSQSYLDVAYTEDGAYPIRGNHTASKAFDINNEGLVVAVPGGINEAGRGRQRPAKKNPPRP